MVTTLNFGGVSGINAAIHSVNIDTQEILGCHDGKLVSCESRSNMAKRVFNRRVSAFATSFLNNDGRVVYSRNGRDYKIGHVINNISVKCVDRALNPQSRGKTSGSIIDIKGKLSVSIEELSITKPKIGRNGNVIGRQLNTSNGKVAGINTPSWSQRANRGRHVPRHSIIENARNVSSEMWSYCLELIDTVKAFPIAFDINTKLPTIWLYRFKLNGVTRLVYPGENFVTRILWAGASLATSEHRSKGRSSGRTINLPEDYDATEPIGSTCQHLLDVDINELVGELYPTKKGNRNESAKDKAARKQYNAAQMAKRQNGIKAHATILKAYVGLPDYTLTKEEIRFLATINAGYKLGNGYSVKPETVTNVPDVVLEDIFTDLEYARKLQYRFSRFNTGKKSPSDRINQIIREQKYIAQFVEDVRNTKYIGSDTTIPRKGTNENIRICDTSPTTTTFLELPVNINSDRIDKETRRVEYYQKVRSIMTFVPGLFDTVTDSDSDNINQSYDWTDGTEEYVPCLYNNRYWYGKDCLPNKSGGIPEYTPQLWFGRYRDDYIDLYLLDKWLEIFAR